jgi:hypothetical protein
MRHRTVWRAALALWLLAIVVRIVRVFAGAAGTRSYSGFVLSVTFFLGFAIVGGYLAVVFVRLLAAIWSPRLNRFRKKRSDQAKPVATLREDGAGMVIVGLVIEGFFYWFAFLSLLGLAEGLFVVGVLAWYGDAASFWPIAQ